MAIKLAETRGFDAVGLREVAEQAGVALGTLYRSFSSKEEIIGAAVRAQTSRLRRQFDRRPAAGADALERLDDLFARMTRVMVRRPAYARAVLSAVSASHPDIAGSVLEQDGETTRIIVGALRGVPPHAVDPDTYSEPEAQVAFLLRHIWFASMVGWAAGLYPAEDVLEHVKTAAALLTRGAGIVV
ncbi:MAG: TetR/AcrR family transcriptional regulator [Sandaracinaceae bacterium]